jgi:hypothetical protein
MKVKNELFADGVMGTDLVAINLQRGRDHGLPSYVHFRRVCNVGDASSFADLRSNIKPEVNDFLVFIIFFQTANLPLHSTVVLLNRKYKGFRQSSK